MDGYAGCPQHLSCTLQQTRLIAVRANATRPQSLAVRPKEFVDASIDGDST